MRDTLSSPLGGRLIGLLARLSMFRAQPPPLGAEDALTAR